MRASFASQRQTDATLDVAQPQRATRIRPNRIIRALCKDTPDAAMIDAGKAAHLKEKGHGVALPWQIRNASLVTTMHARRGSLTNWAAGSRKPRAADNVDAFGSRHDLFNDEMTRDERQNALGHGATAPDLWSLWESARFPFGCTETAEDPTSGETSVPVETRLRDELLDGEIFYTLAEAKIVVESWRRHFNTVRPHGSLGYKPPAPEVFIPSIAARAAVQPRPATPPALAPRPTVTNNH